MMQGPAIAIKRRCALWFSRSWPLDWYEAVFELIDLRSFSNLWYWIALALFWSSANHYILGVPFDLVLRAKREGGQAETDLRDMVRVTINRLLIFGEMSGVLIFGFVCFLLMTLFLLGFIYSFEFAQALFLILFPMGLLGLMSIRAANSIEANVETMDQLNTCLLKHRFWTQVLGTVSILITAIWGMYHNIIATGF